MTNYKIDKHQAFHLTVMMVCYTVESFLVYKQIYFICIGVYNIMKAFPAFLFALAMTAIIAISMLIIGGNALANHNTSPILNAPPASNIANVSDPSSNSSSSSDTQLKAAQQQINQMQQLINQYQTREQQYQNELKQAAQKVNDANAQLAQANQQLNVYQQVMQALQQRGIIQISQDGTIYLRGGGDGNGF